MATEFFGTPTQETFVNTSIFDSILADPNQPFGPVLQRQVFADNFVDYGFSPSAVFINLETNPQNGGYASGDTLVNIFKIDGTAFNDVIRGSDLFVYSQGVVVNNPGANILNGFGGNDILEGRGGADILDGGSGSDTASYESSPAAVNVTVNNPTTGAFSTSGGDAAGDSLISIENLTGSIFSDTLTGSTNNNVLAGGRGSDTLNGMGGTDTADYSRDSFFEPGNTIDRVVVVLGLNGANGTGTEFRLNLPDNFFTQLSVDTLISIENVIGTAGPDDLFGNQVANTLDGRDGNDLLDGGLGADILIGGLGNDTVTYASHNGVTGQIATISLGVNGADGLARFATTGSRPLIVESDVLRGVENVIGSNLTETITGNEQDNVLAGRGGNDKVNGGTGNDTYDFRGAANFLQGADKFFDESGTADKVLINSFSDISSSLRAGNDLVVTLSTGSFVVIDHFAGHAIENIVAGGVTVVLAAGTIGGPSPGIISGTDKSDTLDGAGGDDLLFGNGGADTLIGGTGDDFIDGGDGKDTISGDDGNDTITGGGGKDTIDGGADDDWLSGGEGHDFLTGGTGSDTFSFGDHSGHDEITDFVVGTDHLEFLNGTTVQNLQKIDTDGDNLQDATLLTLGGGDDITLIGITSVSDWHVLL